MKVVLIGTDTSHRRHIINQLINKGHNITHCIFETKKKIPPFETRSDWEIAGETELNACLAAGGCDIIPANVSVKYLENLNSILFFAKVLNYFDSCNFIFNRIKPVRIFS